MNICIFSRAMRAHRAGAYLWPFEILSQQFAALGHSVTVLTTAHPDGITQETRHEGGIDVCYLSGTRPERPDEDFWNASAAAFLAMHAVRPFDLVVGRSKTPWGLVRMAGSTMPPLILHEGTYPGWLHRHDLSPKTPDRIILPARALLDARRNRTLGRCLRAADRVVCVSSALAGALRRLFWWNPPETAFIPYGIDMVPYGRAARPPATREPHIICCGRLARSKGAGDMLEILALLKDRSVRLSAIGPVDLDYLSKLKALAAKLGIQARVNFCGPVPHGDIPQRLAGADAYLFPSTHAEGLSKTVMEAMAASLPVVAYDLPALRGLIETGVEGIVVPAGRIDLAARGIDTILASPDRGRAMGRRARARIERDYTTAQASRAWRDLLAEVVPDVRQGARQPGGGMR